MSGRASCTRERVRWGDVDPVAIVRYDAYVRFFDAGEAELFRAAGLPSPELFARHRVVFPRRVMHVEYFSPSAFDELLEIRTTITRVGTTSFTMRHEIGSAEGGPVRVTGELVLVCMREGSREASALPPEIVQAITPFRVDD